MFVNPDYYKLGPKAKHSAELLINSGPICLREDIDGELVKIDIFPDLYIAPSASLEEPPAKRLRSSHRPLLAFAEPGSSESGSQEEAEDSFEEEQNSFRQLKSVDEKNARDLRGQPTIGSDEDVHYDADNEPVTAMLQSFCQLKGLQRKLRSAEKSALQNLVSDLQSFLSELIVEAKNNICDAIEGESNCDESPKEESEVFEGYPEDREVESSDLNIQLDTSENDATQREDLPPANEDPTASIPSSANNTNRIATGQSGETPSTSSTELESKRRSAKSNENAAPTRRSSRKRVTPFKFSPSSESPIKQSTKTQSDSCSSKQGTSSQSETPVTRKPRSKSRSASKKREGHFSTRGEESQELEPQPSAVIATSGVDIQRLAETEPNSNDTSA